MAAPLLTLGALGYAMPWMAAGSGHRRPDMEALNSLQDLLLNLPRYIDEQSRMTLMVLTALATGLGVGTVTRNHELGWLSKAVVAVLIFAVTFAVGLTLVYFVPVLAEMGRASQGTAK